jgi:hypothetical protein
MIDLRPAGTKDSRVEEIAPGRWKLSNPPGEAGRYRWAQLDDYLPLARKDFLWKPPLRMSLRARASDNDIHGTWGFGFWNDPFTSSLGIGGTRRLLPVLPNAAWFFFASRPNFITFRDDLPTEGMLAATFRVPNIPPIFLLPGVILAPFLFIPPAVRLIRRVISRIIAEDASLVDSDFTQWHAYGLEWRQSGVRFYLDDQLQYETGISPHAPLGFVLWIDNQYASFPPSGKISRGTLETPQDVYLEVEDISISPL